MGNFAMAGAGTGIAAQLEGDAGTLALQQAQRDYQRAQELLNGGQEHQGGKGGEKEGHHHKGGNDPKKEAAELMAKSQAEAQLGGMLENMAESANAAVAKQAQAVVAQQAQYAAAQQAQAAEMQQQQGAALQQFQAIQAQSLQARGSVPVEGQPSSAGAGLNIPVETPLTASGTTTPSAGFHLSAVTPH